MLRLALLIYIIFLTACSTTSETNTFTPMPVDDGQAAVYIYRPAAMSNAMYSPDIFINDEFKLSVKNGKNARITLPAGKYILNLEADNNQSQQTSLSLDLKPATTVYLRVTTSLSIKSPAQYEPYQRLYNIEAITEQQAKVEIAECCSSKKKQAIAESEVETPKKESGDGFSVDKTQNPFSH